VRPTWLALAVLGLAPAALAQDDEAPTEEPAAADDEDDPETADPADPAAPVDGVDNAEAPVPDPLQERLTNSTHRDWPGTRTLTLTNRVKATELPLYVVQVPEPVAAADDPTRPLPGDDLDDLDERVDQDEPDRGDFQPGYLPAMFATAWTGAWVGTAYGLHWGNGEPGRATLGGVLGGLAGTAGGYGLGVGLEPTVKDSTALAVGAMTGTWLGHEVGQLVLAPNAKDRGERAIAWAALGDLAGLGAAVALQGRSPDITTSVGFTLAGASGWQLAAGIGDLAGWTHDNQPRQRAALELALGAGLGAGLGAAHHLDLWAPPDPIWTAIGLAEGTWFGAWLPWALHNQPTDTQRTGTARISLAVGYLASVGITPFLEPDPKRLALQAWGFSVGTLVGAGIPLLNPQEAYPRQAVIPMLAGGLAGQIAATTLASRYSLEPEDSALVAMLWGWTGYQMVGWGLMADGQDLGERRTTGLVLATAGVGTLVSWGLPAIIDPSPRQSVLILSAGTWGTWYGAWTSYLLRSGEQGTWTATLATGDVALLGMAGATAAGFDPSWAQIGLVNAAGAAGAGFGALVGVLASPDPRSVSFASLIGTTAGLAGGTVLAAVRFPSDGSATSAWSWPALRRQREVRLPIHLLPMAAPWISEDGDVGVLLQVAGFGRQEGE
jgi:hypothetical protein